MTLLSGVGRHGTWASTYFFFPSFRAFSRSAGSVDLPPDELGSPNTSLVRSFTCPLTSPVIQTIYLCGFLVGTNQCDRKLCLPVRSESLDMVAVLFDAGSPWTANDGRVRLLVFSGRKARLLKNCIILNLWFKNALYTTRLGRQENPS